MTVRASLRVAWITLAVAATRLLDSSAAAGVNQWTVVGPPENVRTMAVDPHDHRTLYAAGFDSVARSHDRGATWTSTPVPGLGRAAVIRTGVSVSSTLYVLGDSELFRSVNGGLSWSKRKIPMTAQSPMDLQVHPTNANLVFVAAWNFCFLGCSGGGVFRSDDGGGSWERIGFKDTNAGHVALHPTSSQILYATSDTKLHKTTDGGRSWRDVSPPAGGEVNNVVVDPVVPTTVYAGAEGGVFRSSDSGASWELVRSSSFGGWIADPAYGSRHLFASATGLALSLDQGQTWRELGTAGSGLDFRGVSQVVVSPGIYYMVADLLGAPGQILAYEVRHPKRRAVRH